MHHLLSFANSGAVACYYGYTDVDVGAAESESLEELVSESRLTVADAEIASVVSVADESVSSGLSVSEAVADVSELSVLVDVATMLSVVSVLVASVELAVIVSEEAEEEDIVAVASEPSREAPTEAVAESSSEELVSGSVSGSEDEIGLNAGGFFTSCTVGVKALKTSITFCAVACAEVNPEAGTEVVLVL